MALFTIARAVFGYLFLVFITRIVGRRPGKQLTPFEFVLVFYLGGLTLTGMVGKEGSLASAAVQIVTLAACHYGIALLRSRSARVARVTDGTPLILLEGSRWRTHSMKRMGLEDDDVMAMARDQGMRDLKEIGTAALERNGEISIIPKEKS